MLVPPVTPKGVKYLGRAVLYRLVIPTGLAMKFWRLRITGRTRVTTR